MRRFILCGMTMAAITWTSLAPARAETIPEMLPAETLLYLQWPGIESLSKSASETEFARMMNEPEILRFRRQWREQIWPALEDMMAAGMGDGATALQPIMTWLDGMWTYPTGVALAGVDMGPAGPQIDVAVIVRAGRDARSLVDAMDQLILMVLEGAPPEALTDVTVRGTAFKQVLLPEMPIPFRYGTREGDVILTLGTGLHDRWMTQENAASSLQASDNFKTALQTTEGSDLTPLMYLNLESMIQTLERFQGLFAGLEVPVLGEEGGVQRVLEATGYAGVKSLTVAMRPHAQGFKSTGFLHLPDAGATENVNWVTERDVQLIPRQVTWAGVSKGSLVESYKGLLGMIEGLSPEVHGMIGMFIGQFEAILEMPLEEFLGGFGETWIVYDAPDHGGLWFTGLTLVVEVNDDNKIDQGLRRLISALATALEADGIIIREEEYRDMKIAYVNVAGLPMPVAPAWAEIKGHWILALHPQMVRCAADHILDGHPSLADNADFQRARALMPDNVDALSYGDVKKGVEVMYRFALPLAQMGISMAQSEGIPVDASLMPSMPAISRHLFGAIGASTATKDGYVWMTHTPIPGFAPASGMSANVSTTALVASVLLPSLARARELSKRTVSASNMKHVALGCLMYAEDHRGELPPDLETLLEGGEQAYLQASDLKSPQDDSAEEISYIYIPGQKVTMDPRNILAYERPDINDGEGVNVVFLDGHVEFLTMWAFEEQLAATEERLGLSDEEQPIEGEDEEPSEIEEEEPVEDEFEQP